MNYLTYEDFKAQNSKVNCQRHTTSSSLCYFPILNILIIFYKLDLLVSERDVKLSQYGCECVHFSL